MKKPMLVLSNFALSFILFGCSNIQEFQVGEQVDSVPVAGKEQKIIIRDSVDEPLPPETKGIQTMPGKSEPQPLPNVDLDAPVVITKMPHLENQTPK